MSKSKEKEEAEATWKVKLKSLPDTSSLKTKIETILGCGRESGEHVPNMSYYCCEKVDALLSLFLIQDNSPTLTISKNPPKEAIAYLHLETDKSDHYKTISDIICNLDFNEKKELTGIEFMSWPNI